MSSERTSVSRNALSLGWVSLFNCLASEMLYPVILLFLVGMLGVSPALLGVVDVAEGISSGLRRVGGALAALAILALWAGPHAAFSP